MTRRVVLQTADADTRRRVEAALGGRQVEVVDPTRREDTECAVVGDVAVLDTQSETEPPAGFEPTHVVRVTNDRADDHGRADESERADHSDRCQPDALCVEKPVDPDALCAAVDRAFKRLTYVEGLDAFTAAATGDRRGTPDAGQASLGESLRELAQTFDHGDFTAAFRSAVAGH